MNMKSEFAKIIISITIFMITKVKSQTGTNTNPI